MGEQIELGRSARDTITGYTGVVTAICSYLHGSDRVQLQVPGLTSDGEPVAAEWFDIDRVSVMREGR